MKGLCDRDLRVFVCVGVLLITSLACYVPGILPVDTDEEKIMEIVERDEEPSEAENAEEEEESTQQDDVQEEVLDVCTLLPVDESAVTITGKDACAADIDSLIGCGECNSDISITRLESVARAQEVAVDGNCGNPNFSARGESPIGSAGFTCTKIEDEEYREGVAQSYFYVSFSHDRYAVSISTGYPGKESFALDLGQQTIERIDNTLE
jgi:hypothetical protein